MGAQELEDLIVAQSNKMKTIKQEESRVPHHSKGEGLEAHCRVPSAIYIGRLKKLKADV